jgi:hypothetical protein
VSTFAQDDEVLVGLDKGNGVKAKQKQKQNAGPPPVAKDDR